MRTLESWLSLALWLAGAGHFCLLIASFQVPHQLGWKDDLPKLTAFNRKLMWVYGGFTLLTIVAFGMLTFLLHDDFLAGDRAAMALAAFIAVYWTARILVDCFYYQHADWPTGRRFVVGHFLLTALFVALAGTFWSVLAWNFWN